METWTDCGSTPLPARKFVQRARAALGWLVTLGGATALLAQLVSALSY